mgnify:CR=1 FL=1
MATASSAVMYGPSYKLYIHTYGLQPLRKHSLMLVDSVLSCLLAEQDKCMEGTHWKCHANNNESQFHKIWWHAVQCAKLNPVITWFSFHQVLHVHKCNEYYRDKYFTHAVIYFLGILAELRPKYSFIIMKNSQRKHQHHFYSKKNC